MTQVRSHVANSRSKMKRQSWSHPNAAAKRGDRSVYLTPAEMFALLPC